MRVRVLKEFTAYWNYAITTFRDGAELEGDQARHFLDNAPAGSLEVLKKDPEPQPHSASAKADPDPDPVTADGGPPIDGTIDDLMGWVDGNPERAAQALDAEKAKDKPRSTVVKRLTALAGDDEE